MSADTDELTDLELRLVDPSKNRFRIYGLTECRTLFGELCLKIVWGRIGNRRLRERSEVFADRTAMMRRREVLLGRRQRHGYVSSSTPRAVARARSEQRVETPLPRSVEQAITEDHGLRLDDTTALSLIRQWHAATLAVRRYIELRSKQVLDLVDVSTLADMFVKNCIATPLPPLRPSSLQARQV